MKAKKDKHQAEKDLTNPYSNSETWVKSTMAAQDCDIKDLVKIYEVANKDIRERVRERMWLHDVLDDNNIQYRIEIVGYWSKRKYYEKQQIFVKKEHETAVRRYIAEYNKNIVEEIDEENMADDIEDGLPQIKCPSCGREIDFDHIKCPFCKTPI